MPEARVDVSADLVSGFWHAAKAATMVSVRLIQRVRARILCFAIVSPCERSACRSRYQNRVADGKPRSATICTVGSTRLHSSWCSPSLDRVLARLLGSEKVYLETE